MNNPLQSQGLHTKMVQVCAKCLSIPVEKIHLNDTSSDKVPNATATAASTSSDLYGMAVKVGPQFVKFIYNSIHDCLPI